MKIMHSAILVLAISAASISSAVARDSFNIGINVGGYGYPYAQYYAGPPVVYYGAPPVVYYRPAPPVYSYAPSGFYGYQSFARPGYVYQSPSFNRGWNNGGRGHRGHGHHRGRR